VKNLNSFANVERALEAERERQIGLVERGERVAQVTLLFNAGRGSVFMNFTCVICPSPWIS